MDCRGSHMLNIHNKSKPLLHSIWIAMLLALLISFSGQGCTGKSSTISERATKKGAGGIETPVMVSKVVQKDVPIDIESVGTVEACSTVMVKSQVSGELTQVLIREGDFVKKDQELFLIDARTYQAQLNQAQANLAKDEAVLAQVESNLVRDIAQQKYVQAEAARNRNLLEKKLVSQSQAEQASASADAAAAAVQSDRAAIQSARATVEATKAAVANAQVMLSYTIIKSPLDGRSGNFEVTQGNVVNPSTALMSILQMAPIHVTFSIPEAQLRDIKTGQFVSVFSQEDGLLIETGKLSFIDNTVDVTTGMVRLKALFPNKDYKLWPGEFIRVKLRLSIRPGALIIPNQAMQTGQDGTFVFVVKSDKTVESRPVLPGMRVEQDLVIEKGLHPGEIIVTEGQIRLTAGSRVKFSGDEKPSAP
jgi:membrane fusion protein, multidrug efflux system